MAMGAQEFGVLDPSLPTLKKVVDLGFSDVETYHCYIVSCSGGIESLHAFGDRALFREFI